MTTYTASDVRTATAALADEATRAGIMQASDVLVFHKGNRTNGISPYFTVFTPAESPNGSRRASFLPDFTCKSSNREMVFAIDAARLAFNAVNNRA